MDAILQLNPKWETELCLNKAPLGWTMVSWSFLIEQSTKKLEKASKYRILCSSLLWTCGNWQRRQRRSTEIPIFTALRLVSIVVIAGLHCGWASQFSACRSLHTCRSQWFFHWLLAASNHKIPKIHWITYWNYRITRLTSCLGRSWVFLGHNSSILLQQQMFCQTKNIRSDPSTEQSMSPCLLLAFET